MAEAVTPDGERPVGGVEDGRRGVVTDEETLVGGVVAGSGEGGEPGLGVGAANGEPCLGQGLDDPGRDDGPAGGPREGAWRRGGGAGQSGGRQEAEHVAAGDAVGAGLAGQPLAESATVVSGFGRMHGGLPFARSTALAGARTVRRGRGERGGRLPGRRGARGGARHRRGAPTRRTGRNRAARIRRWGSTTAVEHEHTGPRGGGAASAGDHGTILRKRRHARAGTGVLAQWLRRFRAVPVTRGSRPAGEAYMAHTTTTPDPARSASAAGCHAGEVARRESAAVSKQAVVRPAPEGGPRPRAGHAAPCRALLRGRRHGRPERPTPSRPPGPPGPGER
ncbi:hypothetical protein STENM223S_03134 [Streptomyces tendae]